MSKDLKLALDSVTGAALLPEDLEVSLVELAKGLFPLLNIMNIRKGSGNPHQYNQRTNYGTANFAGENASGTTTRGSYVRQYVPLKKIVDRRSVSGMLEAGSQKLTDAYKDELTASAAAMGQKLELGFIWGQAKNPAAPVPAVAVGDSYFFTGMEQSIRTNVFEKSGVLQLSDLDSLLDEPRSKGAGGDQMMFAMSPQMLSKASSLEPNKFKDIAVYEFAGGARMASYRGVPIWEAQWCREPHVMGGFLGVADSVTVGALVAGKTYGYKISKITAAGESVASGASALLVGGGKSAIDLTWTPEADAILYRIFRTIGDGGTYYFLGSVPAFAYTADGDIVTTNGAWTDVVGDAYLDLNRTPHASNEEEIFLFDTSPLQSYELASMMAPESQAMKNLFGYIPLARTKDSRDFLLTCYAALAMKGEIFNSLLRRVRIA